MKTSTMLAAQSRKVSCILIVRMLFSMGVVLSFEFCDFVDMKTRSLCFAKLVSRSSGMSHLVEQVRRTTELLFDTDGSYRRKLSEVFKVQHPSADTTWLGSRPRNWAWSLCLVSLGRPAKDLPFFAKCALWKLHRDLIARGHEVFFVQVWGLGSRTYTALRGEIAPSTRGRPVEDLLCSVCARAFANLLRGYYDPLLHSRNQTMLMVKLGVLWQDAESLR